MELFQLALQGKTIQMKEYFLVGSVLDNAKDAFVEILRGLCDNPENRPIEFMETEHIYSAVNNNGVSETLRARSVRTNQPDVVQHCHLRYMSPTDHKVDRESKTMVRMYYDCLTNTNLSDYLQAIGLNLDMELIMRGYLFHKGSLKIVVSKVYTSNAVGDPQPLTQSHFVEISCVMPFGKDNCADEVKRFADLFRPYVKMEKIHQIMEELKI